MSRGQRSCGKSAPNTDGAHPCRGISLVNRRLRRLTGDTRGWQNGDENQAGPEGCGRRFRAIHSQQTGKQGGALATAPGRGVRWRSARHGSGGDARGRDCPSAQPSAGLELDVAGRRDHGRGCQRRTGCRRRLALADVCLPRHLDGADDRPDEPFPAPGRWLSHGRSYRPIACAASDARLTAASMWSPRRIYL